MYSFLGVSSAVFTLLLSNSVALSSLVTNTNNSGPGSLRQIILDASSGDTITFDSSLNGQVITLTTGRISLSKSLSIDATSLTSGISISGNDSSQILNITSSASNVTLSRITFQNGNADDFADSGGAVSIFSTSPSFVDCSFIGNYAADSGGAVIVLNASPLLKNCKFSGNRADLGGGAISNFEESSPTFLDCSFEDNHATGSENGGAIANSFSSPIITNCSFRGNTAGRGAAVDNGSGSQPVLTNCVFQGNSATDTGGAISNQSSSPTYINCSFQGNSSNNGGAIFNVSSDSNLTNCIIWNNSSSGRTNSSSASILSISSSDTYSHCLIQNINLSSTETNNFNGRVNTNAPLFISESDPSSAPTTNGDLRILTSSPTIDAGSNSENNEATDLIGNPRIQGSNIDLGAYEGNLDATFSLLHPSLNETDDENLNGLTNYTDYALGTNPTAPHDPSVQPNLISNQLTLSFRNNATDVFFEVQKSDTLLANDWAPLILGTDYTIGSETVNGSTTTQILDLLTSDPSLFFRQLFFEFAP